MLERYGAGLNKDFNISWQLLMYTRRKKIRVKSVTYHYRVFYKARMTLWWYLKKTSSAFRKI